MVINLTDDVGITTKRVTDEGFLVIEKARIARTGIQDYFAGELGLTDRDHMDIVKVLRPAEEVFKDESMKTFANKPITNTHPEGGIINSSNAKTFTVGFTGSSVTRDGDFLIADLTITDIHMIEDIEAGRKQISNGYRSGLVETKDEGAEFKQIDIKGNHIAIVDTGRCGPACKVTDEDNINPKKGDNKMPLLIDGIPFQTDDVALIAAVNKLEESKTKVTDSISTIETEHAKEVSALTSDRDKLQAKVDDAVNNTLTPQQLDEYADKRASVIAVAVRVIGDKFSKEGKDCEQIRKEVVQKDAPDFDLKDKSQDYIDARFDMIADKAKDKVTKKGVEPKSLEQAMIDAAEGSVVNINDMNSFQIARERKIIQNKILHRFPVGTIHRSPTVLSDAVDKEFILKFGTKGA